jgi:hypothetical protein
MARGRPERSTIVMILVPLPRLVFPVRPLRSERGLHAESRPPPTIGRRGPPASARTGPGKHALFRLRSQNPDLCDRRGS